MGVDNTKEMKEDILVVYEILLKLNIDATIRVIIITTVVCIVCIVIEYYLRYIYGMFYIIFIVFYPYFYTNISIVVVNFT